MNSLFGQSINKNTEFKHEFKIENFMDTEYDDRIEEYHNMEDKGYVINPQNYERIDDGIAEPQKN